MKKDEILNFLKEFKKSSQNKIFSEIGLFGSYAKNENDVYSDIDVAIKIDSNALSKYDVWEYFDALNKIKSSLLERFGLKSDIFDMDSQTPLVEKIKKDIIYV